MRNAGVRIFNHADASVAEPSPLAGGESAVELLPLLTAPGALSHDRAGCVLRKPVVADARVRPPRAALPC